MTNTNTQLEVYGSNSDISAMADKIKMLLPGGKNLTPEQAMMLSQFSIAARLNPFLGECWMIANERTHETYGVVVGIKGLRRYGAHQMEAVSGNYWIQFRLITAKEERDSLGILGTAIAYEARLFDSETLRNYGASWDQLRKSGVPNEVIGSILGTQPFTSGIGVWKQGEATKMQPSQCAQFRAEKDALKRRFYIPFGAMEDADETDAGASDPVTVSKPNNWAEPTTGKVSEDGHADNQSALGRDDTNTLIPDKKPELTVADIQKRVDYATKALADGQYDKTPSLLKTYGVLKTRAKSAGMTDEELKQFSPGSDPLASAVCHSIKDMGAAIIYRLNSIATEEKAAEQEAAAEPMF